MTDQTATVHKTNITNKASLPSIRPEPEDGTSGTQQPHIPPGCSPLPAAYVTIFALKRDSSCSRNGMGPLLGDSSFRHIRLAARHNPHSSARNARTQTIVHISLPHQAATGSLSVEMAKEQFFYSDTQPLFKKLEELTRRSGVSRGQAFEDLLTAIVCALAAESKEAEYLAMVERHKGGKHGQRGIDLMPQMLAELVEAMTRTDADILGDLFQGSVTYGEAGQYFSPASIARLLAEMSVDPDTRPTADTPLLISDCCCGTGRMLLEASNVNPHAELVGQDIDSRSA